MLAFFFKRSRGLLIAVAVWAQSSPANASQPPVEEDARPSYESVVAGIRDRIDSTHSGVVSVTGRKRLEEPGEAKREGPVEIFCAFDGDFRNVRFDRKEFHLILELKEPMGNPVKAPPPDTPVKQVEFIDRFFRTPDMSGTFHRWQLQLFDSDHPPHHWVRPFDPRCLGLFNLSDTFPTAESVFKDHLTIEPERITSEANGQVRIEWQGTFKGSTQRFRRVMLLDRRKGFTPLRYELQLSDRKVMDHVEWMKPIALTTVSWQWRAGTWIPEECNIEMSNTADYKRTYQLKFEWSSVNEWVSPDYFAPADLASSGGTIIDMRVNPPVMWKRAQ